MGLFGSTHKVVPFLSFGSQLNWVISFANGIRAYDDTLTVGSPICVKLVTYTSATERWEEHTQDYHMGPKKSVKYAQSQAIPSSIQATGLELA